MEEKLRKYCKETDIPQLVKRVEEKLKRISPTMEYVRNLILDVKLFLRLLTDEEFDLKEEAKRDMVCALLYFVEEKDGIPDWVPIIGLWDDYKVVRYVKNKHADEIARYFSVTKHFIANYF